MYHVIPQYFAPHLCHRSIPHPSSFMHTHLPCSRLSSSHRLGGVLSTTMPLLFALSSIVLAASSVDAFVSSPRAVLPSYSSSGRINTHAACRNAATRGGPSSLSMHGGHHLSAERKAELVATATAMSQSGKGLTACDEGPGTIGDRFEKVGIDNTEENRRKYRQMLFTVANGDQFLSGAILDPETVYQKTDDGVLFPELLTSRGIVPGVKPHLKVYELPGCKPGETVMQGLDSLAARCKEYYAAGCRFAKWRSPLVIGVDGDISALAIQTNMDDLARCARPCSFDLTFRSLLMFSRCWSAARMLSYVPHCRPSRFAVVATAAAVVRLAHVFHCVRSLLDVFSCHAWQMYSLFEKRTVDVFVVCLPK